MSAGGIAVLPAAVVVAAGAVVVLTAAAAAVLVVRAANAAAEGAVRALGDYGAELERIAAGQAAAEVAQGVWQAVAAEVVEVNARIRMLRDRASRAGASVVIPEELRLEGRDLSTAVAWLPHARQLLAHAQESMLTAALRTGAVQLPAVRDRSAERSGDVAAALARYQQSLRDRFAAPTAATMEAARGVNPDEITAALRGMDPDADERDHTEVLRAAAAADRDDPREAAIYLLALRAKVNTVNTRTAHRRLAAQWLSALEEPVVARVDPPPPLLGTAERLRAVVAGDAELTPALRTEGLEAVEWAAEVTRRHFVRETVRACLADEGYRVEGEFEVRHSAGLRLGRADWHGEHSAEVWVDDRGVVRGRVVRHAEDVRGDEAVLRNRGRCDTFNQHLRALGETLDSEVVIDHGHLPQYSPPERPIEAETLNTTQQNRPAREAGG